MICGNTFEESPVSEKEYKFRTQPLVKRLTKRRDAVVEMAHLPRKCDSLFLDSGAFTLYMEFMSKNRKDYSFYGSKLFEQYLDDYAAFVKKYGAGIDWYANLDVIYDPQKSWDVQKYLEEKHGLRPVPVFHIGSDYKWLDKIVEGGYELIGLGGLARKTSREYLLAWADTVFERLCPASNDYKPIVKVHGFAATSHRYTVRYPWWSVDSVSWAKAAGFGCIFVPHKRAGDYDYATAPYVMGVSHNSTFVKLKGKHYQTLTPREKDVLHGWLDEIGIPFGKVDDNGITVEQGVHSEYALRAVANIRYFERLCKWLPEWPWAFRPNKVRGFF